MGDHSATKSFKSNSFYCPCHSIDRDRVRSLLHAHLECKTNFCMQKTSTLHAKVSFACKKAGLRAKWEFVPVRGISLVRANCSRLVRDSSRKPSAFREAFVHFAKLGASTRRIRKVEGPSKGKIGRPCMQNLTLHARPPDCMQKLRFACKVKVRARKTGAASRMCSRSRASCEGAIGRSPPRMIKPLASPSAAPSSA